MARRIAILVGVLAVAAAAVVAAALYMADGKGPVAAGSAAAPAADGPWGPKLQVSTGSDYPPGAIAASGRVVHIVWGSAPIRYRRSLDEGETWSEDVVLAERGEPRLTDPLAAEGSNVYIVYLRKITTFKDWCCPRRMGDIYFRRSRDGGTTWEPEVRLTTAGGAFRISLAVSGPRLDMVWMDFRTRNDGDIYYRRSPDGGGTWDPEVRLVSGDPSAIGAGRPQVASLGDSVHVVWMDGRDRNPRCYTMPKCTEVYYKRSLDGGRTWGGDVRLTFDPPFSGRPDVAALAPSTVIVSYDEDRDANQGHEQHILRSNDNGSTWAPTVRLTDAPGDSTHPALVALGSTVHHAWFDRRPAESRQIYYRASFDGGASWQTEELVTAYKRTGIPLLAATPGYVHVIRLGSPRLWYLRRKLVAPPAIGGKPNTPP